MEIAGEGREAGRTSIFRPRTSCWAVWDPLRDWCCQTEVVLLCLDMETTSLIPENGGAGCWKSTELLFESENRSSHVSLFATPWTIQSMEFSRPVLEWVAMPSSGDLPNPEIRTRSSAFEAYSLPTEPPGKPKNPGVGSLFLLQWIFLTQELNWGLLNCRWILYHLSYQGTSLWEDKISRNGYRGWLYNILNTLNSTELFT